MLSYHYSYITWLSFSTAFIPRCYNISTAILGILIRASNQCNIGGQRDPYVALSPSLSCFSHGVPGTKAGYVDLAPSPVDVLKQDVPQDTATCMTRKFAWICISSATGGIIVNP